MKILMTTDLYTPSINGVVTSIRTLKHALEEEGHDVRVLTLSDRPGYDSDSGVYSVSSVSLNKVYPGARLSLALNDKISKLIMDWKPDLIHTHCEFSTFQMAKALAKALDVPIIHTYHTIYEDYTHYFSPNQALGKKFAGLISRHVLKQTNHVIAPTEKVKRLLESYQVDQDIAVIPTGICSDQFCYKVSQEDKRLLRQKYGFSNDDRVLLCLGRLAKEKNISKIINYLSRLNNQPYKLLICGDGPHKEALMQEVVDLQLTDQVKFAGMIEPSQVPAYYQMADVFVSASESETQGLTYIEALMSGLPLLCQEDDCLDQVLLPDKNGYTFRDEQEFSYYLDILFSNQVHLQTMGKFAQNQAQKTFSAHAFSLAILDLYVKVLHDYNSSNLVGRLHYSSWFSAMKL